MTPTLTIALPLHNAERTLARTVRDILDVAQVTARGFMVILIDNGSTDDTYEAAYQLSRCYPQVSVLWQPIHSGLGTIIELIRTRVTTDRILVHDGISPICATQFGHMLARANGPERKMPCSSSGSARRLRRFAPISALTENMQRAHQAVAIPAPYAAGISDDPAGFQWIPQAKPLASGRRAHASQSNSMPAPSHTTYPEPTVAQHEHSLLK